MMRLASVPKPLLFLSGALLVTAASAGAQTVQITPFAAYQFGGSVESPLLEQKYSFGSGFTWGGALDIAVGESWRLEFLYSRQETALEAAGGGEPDFELNVERYFVGIQEEKGETNVKYFGTLLLGATRFVPASPDLGVDTRFTAGLALGVKSFFARNVGLRLEARGFYTVVESGGGVFCSAGTCLFRFSGKGIWQGDVSGGLILAF